MATGAGLAISAYSAYEGQSSSHSASRDQSRLDNMNMLNQMENQRFQQEAYDYAKDMQGQYLDFAGGVYEDAQGLAEQQRVEAQRQYQDWEAMFGPIQENLANYYSSMDPKDFALMGKGTIDEAYQTASDSLQKNLAQRGIQGGGVEAGAQAQLESATALARGQNTLQSEAAYAQAQQDFLATGNQQSQAEGNYLNSLTPNTDLIGASLVGNAFSMVPNASGVANAANSISNTMTNQASAFTAESAAAATGVSSSIGSAMYWGNQAYDAYQPAPAPTYNIPGAIPSAIGG